MSPVAEQPQHMTALRKANLVKNSRAAIRRDIFAMSYREGRRMVADIVLDPGSLWGSAKLDYLLRVPRSCGRTFVGRVCREAGVGPHRRLDSLTERQRVVLAGVIVRERRS